VSDGERRPAMVLTGVKKVRNLRTIQQCTRIIEQVFKGFGLDPKKDRLPQKGVVGWVVRRGDAIIYVLLNQNKRMDTLRVISPLVRLPKRNQAAFYRKCLEYNFAMINCYLAANRDYLSIVFERPLTGLNPEEVAYIIDNLSRLADELEKELHEEFGVPYYQ
jgi:hypothetical protein